LFYKPLILRLLNVATNPATLTAARARAKKLGNPQNLNLGAAKKGRSLGTQVRQAKADEHAGRIYGTTANGVHRRSKMLLRG